MKQDNNVLEKRDESSVYELVKKKAIKKATKVTILLAIGTIVFGIIIAIITKMTNIMLLIIPFIGISLLLVSNFLLLTKVYEDDEVRQLYIALVNESMSFDEFTEVIPIRSRKEFILGLVDIAKFSAILSKEDEMVKVYVKFNNEEQSRFLEKIEKENFLYYYSFTEENEEKEE